MRALRILSAALLALLIGFVPTLSQTAAASDDDAVVVETPGVSDDELVDALMSAGVLTSWFELSPVSSQAAMLRVSGSADYQARRADLLDDVAALAASRSEEIELLASISDLESDIAVLDGLARSLRARMMSDGRALSGNEVAALEKAILHARSTVDAGALAAVLDVFEGFRRALSDELVVAQSRAAADKHPDVAGLGVLLSGLDAMYADLDSLRAQAMKTTAAESEIVARIESSMPELHRLRMLGTTDIDDLPLVTIDAYFQAGDHGIDGCAVEWNLIAGIGRIESIHGTLGEASVASNGAVSPRILGPLLDGGATAREAVEAELTAIAEAEEEARVEAEEEARLERIEEDRMRELFGTFYVEPTPEPTPTTEADDEGDSENDEDDTDEDEDEPKGNGFAVIIDTDDGVMDGNPRWDRAVGPMQFIPGTWAGWATDGNGDGVTDPHNLYDATASAASYLCYLERRSGPSPWNYVLGYNASDSYVAAVMRTADRLAGITLPARPIAD